MKIRRATVPRAARNDCDEVRRMSTDQRTPDGAVDQAPTAPPAEGKYVYCIIEAESPRGFGPMGIGGRGHEVSTIHYGGLAAVVSDTPVVVYDPTRENA